MREERQLSFSDDGISSIFKRNLSLFSALASLFFKMSSSKTSPILNLKPNLFRRMLKYSFFLLSLLILACGPNLKTIEVQNERGQITERYTQDPETKLKEGKSYQYYEDGTVHAESDYKQGQLDGQRKLFYPNGQVEIIERYKAGQFEGLFQSYHNDGQPQLEGKYTDHEMGGSWNRYYASGALMEEVHFKQNEENGPFIEYYENGKLKAQGSYLDGDNEHGELKLFDEQGELVKTMDCNKGRCLTTWRKTES